MRIRLMLQTGFGFNAEIHHRFHRCTIIDITDLRSRDVQYLMIRKYITIYRLASRRVHVHIRIRSHLLLFRSRRSLLKHRALHPGPIRHHLRLQTGPRIHTCTYINNTFNASKWLCTACFLHQERGCPRPGVT